MFQITRIQNLELYQQYVQHRNEIAKHCGPEIRVERGLSHNTTRDLVDDINANGFRGNYWDDCTQICPLFFHASIFSSNYRSKMTWRHTVMAELREMGLSWGEAQASAKDLCGETLLWPYVPLGTKRISK